MATKKKSTAKTVSRKKIAKTDVKVKTGRKTFSNFVDYVKLHRIASLFIAVALLGILIYGGMIVYEKWQFNKAEKALDSLYTDIVKELGEPTEVVKDKSCAYSSAKYSQGSRSCKVGYELVYNDYSITDLSEKFYSTLEKSEEINKAERPYRYKNVGSYTLDIDFNGVSFSCGATIGEKEEKQFIIYSCYDSALQEYYPVNK